MSVNPLHRARVGGGIALNQVVARTCLSPRIVQLIDAGEFERLPGGLYARSYVRAFASVVGLDPDTILRELSDRLPAEQDPFPLLRENARADLPPFVRDLARLTDHARRVCRTRLGQLKPRPLPVGELWRRVIAAGVDASVLLLFYAALLRLTASIARLDLQTALEVAGLPVAALSGLVGVLYFLLFGGIGGRTPGAAVCRLQGSAQASPLGLRAICARALTFSPEGESQMESRWDGDAQGMGARC